MPSKRKLLKEFVPGRGYTKDDWDAVDSPPLTKEELASMRPFREVFPEIAANIEKEIGEREASKIAVTLRLDPEVVEKFEGSGEDWRDRMAAELRKAAGF